MMEQLLATQAACATGHGWCCALLTVPAVWYVVDYENDIDPELAVGGASHIQPLSAAGVPVCRGVRHDRPRRGLRFVGRAGAGGLGLACATRASASGRRRWPFRRPASGMPPPRARWPTAGTAWAGGRSSMRVLRSANRVILAGLAAGVVAVVVWALARAAASLGLERLATAAFWGC